MSSFLSKNYIVLFFFLVPAEVIHSQRKCCASIQTHSGKQLEIFEDNFSLTQVKKFLLCRSEHCELILMRKQLCFLFSIFSENDETMAAIAIVLGLNAITMVLCVMLIVRSLERIVDRLDAIKRMKSRKENDKDGEVFF